MEKVLVCILTSTRAHQLTFHKFKRQVLDELNADLALALAIDEKYDYANAFWQHAKYRWTAPDFNDYGDAFDWVQDWLCQQHKVRAPDWRVMLQIKGIWQGGIRSPNPQRTASAIGPFCRWLLLHNLQQDGILDRYDRFVITRSDFVWLCPHPPLSILDRDKIWLPDGENWDGLNDRHLIVSRTDVMNCLNIIEDILLRPMQLLDEMKNLHGVGGWGGINNEAFFAQHLKRKGLLNKVRRFPYVMYSARARNDESPTWSRGYFEPAVGHYVKNEFEYETARRYATVIKVRADWENGAWRRFDPTSVNFGPDSAFRRVRYAGAVAYATLVSALRRPGRFRRFLRLILPGRFRRFLRLIAHSISVRRSRTKA